MASIVFNGHDLSDVSTALVLERGGHGVSVKSAAVPGSAKRTVTTVETEPFAFEVKLMLRPEARTDDSAMMELRRRLRAQLYVDEFELATLRLPDEPGLEWRGVYVSEVSSWDDLFEDGETSVYFECTDPIAYGESKSIKTSTFTVGGTYPTAPTITLTPSAGSAVQVTDPASGRFVRLERSFTGSETVLVDCAAHEVWVNNILANTALTLYSDFFSLPAGTHTLDYTGVKDFTLNFTERWI